MSPGKFDLGEYVDVDARLRWFFDNFPTASLQSRIIVGPEDDKPFVVVGAYAYRGPEDNRPGMGIAYEVFPGTTPYTKGSELMNAETSAWGRALAAIGAPTKGHVASADEVRGASARRQSSPPSSRAKADKATEPPQAEPTSGGDQTGPATEPHAAASEAPPGPSPDHEHTWVQSPTLKKFVVCSEPTCRKVVKKEEVGD